MPLVEVGLLTGLRASNPIDLRWGDKDGKDGAFQGENGSYQEMLVPGGGVEPPWAEARGILSPVRLPVSPPRRWEYVAELISLFYHICVRVSRSLSERIALGRREDRRF